MTKAHVSIERTETERPISGPVFRRTRAGRAALAPGVSVLGAQLIDFLLLVNGTRGVDEIAQLCGSTDSTIADRSIAELLSLGLIEPIERAVAARTPTRSGAQITSSG
jgi:hypothetical protein